VASGVNHSVDNDPH